jgi:hypothetical protein
VKSRRAVEFIFLQKQAYSKIRDATFLYRRAQFKKESRSVDRSKIQHFLSVHITYQNNFFDITSLNVTVFLGPNWPYESEEKFIPSVEYERA